MACYEGLEVGKRRKQNSDFLYKVLTNKKQLIACSFLNISKICIEETPNESLSNSQACYRQVY